MNLVGSMVQVTALINLVGTSLIVGLVWFGWGYELFANQLGLIFLGLFVSSILLFISLVIIHLKILKQNKKFKQKKKRKNQATSLEREFLKEMVERELDKLEPGEMKKFIVDYVLLTQHLIDKYNNLDDLVNQAIQQEETT